MMKSLLRAAIAALLLCPPALAQIPGGGVSQQGSVNVGNCTKWLGAGTIGDSGSPCGGAGGSPGGTTTQLQYNNAGSFGGISGATSNGTTITLVGPILGTPASATLTNATGLPISTGLSGAGTGVLAALGINVGSAGAFVTFNGAGGTPSAITLTNGTGLPISTGVSGLAAGIATWLVTPNSANLAAALTDETGSGAVVFGTAPTISSLNATTALTLAFLTGSTQCLQVNTSGVVSGTGAVCGGSGASGANPTATAGDVAINGVANTFTRSDAAPAIQKASSSLFGIAKVDNTTITAAAGVISAVNTGTVTSVATGCGASGGTITTTGTISAQALVNLQTGANYAILGTDCGKLLNLSNASPQIPTIAQAGTAGFLSGSFWQVCNQGAGTQTITPATSTIGGAATFVLPAGAAAAPQCVTIVSDGTNYQVAPDFTRNAAITIASGTSALGTGAITSATCATVVTTAATGTATTDVVTASFNGDPTAVTGYIPATAGMLTIIAYPTANNVNFKVCNNTAGSITPGAITLNWRVVR